MRLVYSMGFVTKVDGKFARHKRRMRVRFNRHRLQRGLRIIPNLFTLGNGFFGFTAIVLAAQDHILAASYFILLGALMDGLDGRIARYMKITTELGTQLDSLCDAISFCLAPSLLIYFWQLYAVGSLGFMACATFALAGIMRLARFNITAQQQTLYSTGVTTTIAGCFLATLTIAYQHYYFTSSMRLSLLLGALMLAWLMISAIPFPTFKQVSGNAYGIFAGIGVAFIITMGFINVLLWGFLSYFAYTFLRFFWLKFHTPKN
ncbi:CDP-diacylglycerol--serine O-phosphatidyltransferase [Candidatus Dependentiae bacterium]|nr:CDP-diacylglycerol--serine O-phosphatidyltransferase [Candidatus Dependentiae bacterium]